MVLLGPIPALGPQSWELRHPGGGRRLQVRAEGRTRLQREVGKAGMVGPGHMSRLISHHSTGVKVMPAAHPLGSGAMTGWGASPWKAVQASAPQTLCESCYRAHPCNQPRPAPQRQGSLVDLGVLGGPLLASEKEEMGVLLGMGSGMWGTHYGISPLFLPPSLLPYRFPPHPS